MAIARRKSNTAIQTIMMPTTMNTTKVEPMISLRVGQVTRFSSAYDSRIKIDVFSNTVINLKLVMELARLKGGHFPKKSAAEAFPAIRAFAGTGGFLRWQERPRKGRWQARLDSNQQHPVLETGALAVRATGLNFRASENLEHA